MVISVGGQVKAEPPHYCGLKAGLAEINFRSFI